MAESLAAIDLLVTKYIPVRNALKLALAIRGEAWPEDERAFALHLQQQIEGKLDLAEAVTPRAEELEVAMPGLVEWKQEKIPVV